MLLDTNCLEKALSNKTKAVMIAHTLGNPFDIKTVREFCNKHSLWLVEDNCEHYAVIDDEIVWYGSMNLLSKDDVEDNIMRVVSKRISAELLEITFKKGNQLQQYSLPLP